MQVRLQIGMDCGDVVETILGRRLLPRWKLFGDTVNTASRWVAVARASSPQRVVCLTRSYHKYQFGCFFVICQSHLRMQHEETQRGGAHQHLARGGPAVLRERRGTAARRRARSSGAPRRRWEANE